MDAGWSGEPRTDPGRARTSPSGRVHMGPVLCRTKPGGGGGRASGELSQDSRRVRPVSRAVDVQDVSLRRHPEDRRRASPRRGAATVLRRPVEEPGAGGRAGSPRRREDDAPLGAREALAAPARGPRARLLPGPFDRGGRRDPRHLHRQRADPLRPGKEEARLAADTRSTDMRREDDSDRELARMFREVRREDEASAPGFRQTLARGRTDRGSSRRPRLLVAAAVAFSAIVLIAVLLSRRPPATEAPEGPIALGDWRAATD